MTQERLLEIDEMPQLDFFVVDEFYKLDPAHSDERLHSSILPSSA